MSKEITVTGQALYDSYVFDKEVDTTGVINLKAHPFEEGSRASRAPVDIIAVIDVSGSMAGLGKLELVKQTLNFVLDQLKSDDRLAIITFHATVKVELTLTELNTSGKELARRISNELRPQRGTFLSGGLVESLQMLYERSSSQKKNGVASILFLTDGQATTGIKNKDQLKKTIEGFAKSIPDVFSINTFGFGSDHDSELIRTISDASNGMFYFVEKVPDISLAFADCLGGLLSVVAQKIVLEIEASATVNITEVHSNYKITPVEKGKKYTIALNDLFGGEERDIVLIMKVLPSGEPQEHSPLVVAKVHYSNLVTKLPGSVVGSININRAPVEEKQDASVLVLRQIHRLEVAKALKLAAEAGTKNDYTTGHTLLQTTIDSINYDSPRDIYCQGLVSELHTAKTALSNTRSYSTSGYAQLQSQMVSHQQQRSTHTTPMYSNDMQHDMRLMTPHMSPQTPNRTPQPQQRTPNVDLTNQDAQQAFDFTADDNTDSD